MSIKLDDEEVITLEDGFKYFLPQGCIGCFSSANLREIADILDEKNKEWEAQIAEYFRTHPD